MKRTFLMAAGAAALALAPAAAQAQSEGGGSGDRAREAARTATPGVPSQYRGARGRVVGWRPVTVSGVATPNMLVLIETGDGRRVVADLGQDTRGMDLRRGAPIAVRGEAARVGPANAVILADVVRSGREGRTFDIDRPALMTRREPSDMTTGDPAGAADAEGTRG